MDEDRSEPVGVLPPVVTLESLHEALTGVREQLRASDERAAARERIIDRLHDENQRLRAGERQLVLRPVLVDLQQLHTELLRQARDLPATCTAEQASDLLRSFAHSTELALERGGVQVLSPSVGAVFDPAVHRAVEVVAAERPEDDGTVARVTGDGYFDTVQDRAISPATVHVRRWIPPQAPPEPGPAPETADQ
jgi:molecular chaperone GrpE